MGFAISKNLAMHPKATAPYNTAAMGRNGVDCFVLLKHKTSDAVEVQAALAADYWPPCYNSGATHLIQASLKKQLNIDVT